MIVCSIAGPDPWVPDFGAKVSIQLFAPAWKMGLKHSVSEWRLIHPMKWSYPLADYYFDKGCTL
jgi:hypothetical protein